MIALHKYYKFPKTKEGFDFYKKWYKTIDKEDKEEDILEFSKIFKNYSDMFINGNQKTQKLYDLLVEKGDKEALFLKLEAYEEEDNRIKVYQIEKKILEKPSKENFIKLFNFYEKRYRYDDIKRIKILMIEHGFNPRYTQEEIDELIIIQNKEKIKIDKMLDEIIASQDSKYIFKTADTIRKHGIGYHNYALKLYEASFLLDKSNAQAYYNASQTYYAYSKLIRYTPSQEENYKKFQDKSLTMLQKTINLNPYHLHANHTLLKIYSQAEAKKEEYFNLVKKLEQKKEEKKVFGLYLYANHRKNRANKILEELASNGYEEAILDLAVRAFDQEDLDENNLIDLRELYNTYAYKNKELAFKYLAKASEYEDVKSSLKLAKQWYKKSTLDKAKKQLKKLIKE